MMDKVINLKLLAHPMNWFIVLTMLVMAGIAGHLALALIGKSAAKPPATMISAGEQERVLAAQSVLGA